MSWPNVPVDGKGLDWPRKAAQAINSLLKVVKTEAENDARYVLQDQGAAWSAATGTAARTALASYPGQTISNPPTQAEVQTLDDALKAHSQRLVALINDLRSNGTLT